MKPKRLVSLEQEKAFNDKLWSDIMQNLEYVKNDPEKIWRAIDRINITD